jgi:hypothetical protein
LIMRTLFDEFADSATIKARLRCLFHGKNAPCDLDQFQHWYVANVDTDRMCRPVSV